MLAPPPPAETRDLTEAWVVTPTPLQAVAPSVLTEQFTDDVGGVAAFACPSRPLTVRTGTPAASHRFALRVAEVVKSNPVKSETITKCEVSFQL